VTARHKRGTVLTFPRVTTPLPQPPSRAQIVRELAGVALIVLGAVCVLVAAFAVDWRLGVAATGATLCAGGYFLSSEIESD